ncbi:MAG: BrnT family toxin [Chloroflexota bacterium]
MACDAFFDPFICYLDDEMIAGVLREAIMGLNTTMQLLYVVYVIRDEIIRIISARSMTNSEKEIYENQ